MKKLWNREGSAAVLCAQDVDGEQSIALEEITVTAEKRETNLQKTAISIQVNRDSPRQSGKKRIDEIMYGVVGMAARDSRAGSVFLMRGVDAGAVERRM